MRDGWREASLGALLDPVRELIGESHVELVLSVTEGRGIIPQTEVFKKRIATNDLSKYKQLQPLDIAFNPYLLWTGAIGQWKGDVPGATSPVYEVFRSKEEVDARFIGLVLTSGMLTPYFDRTAIGSIQRRRRTTVPVFLDARLALPPLDVQRRIVELVHSVDSVLASLDGELLTASGALQGLREDVAARGSELPLADACEISAKLVDPTDPEYALLPYFGIDRMSKATGELLEQPDEAAPAPISGKYLFGPTDVIYSKIRPNLRKVVWPGFVGLCSADAYPLTPAPGVPSQLLREMLLTEEFTSAVTAKSGRTKMPKVNRAELFEVSIRLPETAEERREASLQLEGARNVVRTLASEHRALKSVREALVMGLLTGAIDVPASYDDLLGEVA